MRRVRELLKHGISNASAPTRTEDQDSLQSVCNEARGVVISATKHDCHEITIIKPYVNSTLSLTN